MCSPPAYIHSTDPFNQLGNMLLYAADERLRLKNLLPVREACEESGPAFIIRVQSKHPRPLKESDLQESVAVVAGSVREQTIEPKRRTPVAAGRTSPAKPHLIWRHQAVVLEQLARHRRRWNIEGTFRRLESERDSEFETLGNPRPPCKPFSKSFMAM